MHWDCLDFCRDGISEPSSCNQWSAVEYYFEHLVAVWINIMQEPLFHCTWNPLPRIHKGHLHLSLLSYLVEAYFFLLLPLLAARYLETFLTTRVLYIKHVKHLWGARDKHQRDPFPNTIWWSQVVALVLLVMAIPIFQEQPVWCRKLTVSRPCVHRVFHYYYRKNVGCPEGLQSFDRIPEKCWSVW